MSANRPLVHMLLGITASSIAVSGFGMWLMPYFSRVHAVSPEAVGGFVGLAYGLPAALGMAFGGVVFARLVRDNDPAGRAHLAMQLMLIAGVAMQVAAFAPALPIALGALAIWGAVNALAYGPIIAAVQDMAGGRVRGFAAAITSLLMNFVGAGLGPLIVGVLSDRFQHLGAGEALRWSIASVSVAELAAVICFFRAATLLGRVAGPREPLLTRSGF